MNVTIKNLNVAYGDKVIFDNFNYQFKENEITCLLGKSAVGKSTLLNALSNLVPYEGEIDVGTISNSCLKVLSKIKRSEKRE